MRGDYLVCVRHGDAISLITVNLLTLVIENITKPDTSAVKEYASQFPRCGNERQRVKPVTINIANLLLFGVSKVFC